MQENKTARTVTQQPTPAAAPRVRSTMIQEAPRESVSSVVRTLQHRPLLNLTQFLMLALLVLLGSLLGGALASRYFSQLNALDGRVAGTENKVMVVDNRATAIDRRLSQAQTSLNQIVLKASDLQGKIAGMEPKVTDLNKRLNDVQTTQADVMSRLTNEQNNISDLERRSGAINPSNVVPPSQSQQ